MGNILENAILACDEIRYGEKFIDLAVRTEDNYLYIVSSNSFSGNVKKIDGKYISTHGGTGIGLSSIQTTAERLGGGASFSHNKQEFYTDVTLQLNHNP